MNKKAHLYAIKIMSAIILGMLVFGLIAAYEPMLLAWLIAIFFFTAIMINLYRIFYEIGKEK